jgi:hypothetical protein
MQTLSNSELEEAWHKIALAYLIHKKRCSRFHGKASCGFFLEGEAGEPFRHLWLDHACTLAMFAGSAYNAANLLAFYGAKGQYRDFPYAFTHAERLAHAKKKAAAAKAQADKAAAELAEFATYSGGTPEEVEAECQCECHDTLPGLAPLLNVCGHCGCPAA